MPAPTVALPERYQAPRRVARGGMATVWAARDAVLERDVAIKVLAESLSDDPIAHERFLREARAAAGLGGHPRVVTIYDIGAFDGRPYLVMELMPGGTVGNRMHRRTPVEPGVALGWIDEAAQALDHAHARGVVHRDVKPGNMLLDREDHLVLADFGIARVADGAALTQTGLILGTAGYLAPECVRGAGASPASDRFALATVAHELLVGERPADGRPSSALPPFAARVLARGLADDPAQRWPSSVAFAEALEDALAEPAPAPRRPRPVPPPPGAPRRRRGPLLVLGVTGLLAGVAAAVAVAAGGGADDPAGSTTRGSTSAARSPTTSVRMSTATTTVTEPAAPAATTAGGSGLEAARRLQVQGYRARVAGDPARALELARQAVASCGAVRQLDPCGYALYELGLATAAQDPKAGLKLLRQRLRLYGDNERGEVAAAIAELQPGRGPKKDKQD